MLLHGGDDGADGGFVGEEDGLVGGDAGRGGDGADVGGDVVFGGGRPPGDYEADGVAPILADVATDDDEGGAVAVDDVVELAECGVRLFGTEAEPIGTTADVKRVVVADSARDYH